MNVIQLFVVCLGFFTVLHFYWIPKLEKRLVLDRSIVAVGRSALLSVLGVLRGVFLISTITLLFIIVTILLLKLKGGAIPSEIESTIGTLKSWRMALVGFGPVWGILVTLFLVIALVIHASRRSKIRMNQVFNKLFETEYRRLEELYGQNKLVSIPPTQEMNRIQEELDNTNDLLHSYKKIEPSEGVNLEVLLQELQRYIHKLKEMLKALDIQRRIELKIDPSEVELPTARTKWERIQTFLMSRGLLKNLNRSNRLVYILCLILLVPSLLGVCAGKIGSILDRRVVELQNLKFNLAIEEVSTNYEKTKNQLGEPVNILNEKDDAVIDEAAHAVEDTIVASYITHFDRVAWFEVRSQNVRNEILKNTVKRAEGGLKSFSSGSKATGLNQLEREILQINESALNGNIPKKSIYQNIKGEFQDIAKRSPNFVERLKAEMLNFKKPANAREINRALISQISGIMTDGVGDGELGRIVQQSVQRMENPANFELMYETQKKRIIVNLLEGKSLGESLNVVELAPEMEKIRPIMRTTLKEIPLDHINGTLRKYPPSVMANLENNVNISQAADDIVKYSNGIKKKFGDVIHASVDFTESLSHYEDFFPPQFMIERNTPRSLLQYRLGYGPAKTFTPELSTKAFEGARNFYRLQSFFRIGGVLIGKPAQNTNLNYIDFNWEVRDSKIKLILTSVDGKVFKSIPHRISLAYSALNYAADDRPIAVTILNSPPMEEQKIFLHPALIDTPMGQRIIELDHFVEKYTSEDKIRTYAIQRVYSYHSLYIFSWGSRLQALIKLLEKNNFSSDIMKLKEIADSITKNDGIKKMAELHLSPSADISNPENSPLTTKKEFYDQYLVQMIISTAKETNNLTQFEQVITQKYLNTIPMFHSKEQIERLLVDPPEFNLCSGVREKNFQDDPSAIIIQEGFKAPHSLRFMLQIAFSSDPGFLEGTEINGKNNGFYVDYQPWEFPALKESINDTVLEKVRNNTRDNTILNDANEFTILQRFFRMAFNGHLGKKFPIEKLLILAKTLESKIPNKKIRTLRWNARPGITHLWERSITNENREEILFKLKLRKELGIPKDEEQIVRERNAPLSPLK